MDIFEFAMKMEMDGRNLCLEHATKIANPELKRILEKLAEDERKHCEIFKSLKEVVPAAYQETGQAKILNSARKNLRFQDEK